MTSKVLSYGVVGLLAVSLVAGVGYILLNPTEVSSQGPIDGQGQGRGRSEIVQDGAGAADGIAAYGQGQPGQGRGRGNEGATAQDQENLAARALLMAADGTLARARAATRQCAHRSSGKL